MAAQSLAVGSTEIMVAGGMESMSNVPYYLPKGRAGLGYGHQSVEDGIIKDGLWDVYNQVPVVECFDSCSCVFTIHGLERTACLARACMICDRGQPYQ